MKTILMTILLIQAIAGCTWVSENTAGRSVAITVIDDVKNCTKVGNISTKVKHKFGFIPRNKDKVTRELQVLARNEAVKLGANTIIANSAPINGKQTYQAFICR